MGDDSNRLAVVEDIDRDRKRRSLLFRRVESSPCLRETFQSAILTGISVGLFTFLITSNVRRATNWALGSYIVSGYPIWFFCSYRQTKKTQRERESIEEYGRKYGMEPQSGLYEGTDYEKQLDRLLEDKMFKGTEKRDRTSNDANKKPDTV